MITIALTCSLEQEKFTLNRRYVDELLRAAENAGITDVVPTVLPLTADEKMIRSFVKTFDGFLFTGGVDIDPAAYGEEKLPECGEICTERDFFELSLARAVAESKKPAFGICRGIQTMNVALGGTLWQDVSTQVCGGKTHAAKDGEGVPRHAVETSGFLKALTGRDRIVTNSYHHQAVKRPGEGLRVAGVSEDGIVEAIEHESLPFYKAAQWHPEMQPDEISQKLFAAFLEEFVDR